MGLFGKSKNKEKSNVNQYNKETNDKAVNVTRYNDETFADPKAHTMLYIFYNKYGDRKVAMTRIQQLEYSDGGFTFLEILNNLYISTYARVEENATTSVRILRYDFGSEKEEKYFMYLVRDTYKELDTVLENKLRVWKSEDFMHIKMVRMNIFAFIMEESFKPDYLDL